MSSSLPHRGVYRAVAPAGYTAIQVIDSAGEEFAQLRIRSSSFDPAFILALRAALERAELPALLRGAFPDRSKRRRGKRT